MHRESLTTWWRNQMETFSALLAICAGNSLVTGEFPALVKRGWDYLCQPTCSARIDPQRSRWDIGFNHGLPWCVKYMARGPRVTTKPDGEAGRFCGDRRPEGHVFHTSRQAMIKAFYRTSIRKNMVQNCSYFTQMKSTTTAIDDSNRRRNKPGLGCSREATAPLILIFKS